MTHRPTPTQADAIRILAEHGGIIEYRKGGFWTYPGCVEHQTRAAGATFMVPEWYITAHTVKALAKRGWLERCHRYVDAWRDDHRLTEAGVQAEGASRGRR